MPKNVLLVTGNKPQHFALIDVLLETGFLSATVLQIDEKPRSATTPLLKKYEISKENAVRKFFGEKYSHTSNLPAKAVEYSQINSPETIDFINKTKPDLLINFDTEPFNDISISQIKCEKWVIISGDGENFNGPNGNFWAVYNGQANLVCHTVCLMSPAGQLGDIVFRTAPTFRPEDTCQDMDKRSIRRLINDISNLMDKYENNTLSYTKPIPKGDFHTETQIKEEDLQKLLDRRGDKYADFTTR